jgi:hypothetical protein
MDLIGLEKSTTRLIPPLPSVTSVSIRTDFEHPPHNSERFYMCRNLKDLRSVCIQLLKALALYSKIGSIRVRLFLFGKETHMARSISIVEYKVQQARFFLEQIMNAGTDFFAVQCFTDAFVASCRTITFSMQAVINAVDGFKEWYDARTECLKRDRVAQFFNSYRIVSTHIGDTLVRGGGSCRDAHGRQVMQYFFMPVPDLPSVPEEDVYSLCKSHFVNLLDLVFDAFWEFRYLLDDRWYYTAENFRKMNKSLEDALAEFDFPRDYLNIGLRIPDSEKWRVLRYTQAAGCQINDIFELYLGKIIRGPDEIAKAAV